MKLKSLMYTSTARADLTATDIADIHHTSLNLNSLEGVTGLLIYNGQRFLQIIEGAENAIDDLVARLLRDTRHSGLKIEDEHEIERRDFADWTMKLAVVSMSYLDACDEIERELPPQLPASVRSRVLEVCKDICHRS